MSYNKEMVYNQLMSVEGDSRKAFREVCQLFFNFPW